MSLNDRLEAHFKAHPGEWWHARELLAIAGFGGWRSRISNLRFAPYSMQIENQVTRRTLPDGTRITDSYYRYRPPAQQTAPMAEQEQTWTS